MNEFIIIKLPIAVPMEREGRGVAETTAYAYIGPDGRHLVDVLGAPANGFD